jgi:hypothetical protein
MGTRSGRKTVIVLGVLLFTAAWVTRAQEERGAEPGQGSVGSGYMPPHGPPDQVEHPAAPHVHTNRDWLGHDSGPNDPRYFTGGFGPADAAYNVRLGTHCHAGFLGSS